MLLTVYYLQDGEGGTLNAQMTLKRQVFFFCFTADVVGSADREVWRRDCDWPTAAGFCLCQILLRLKFQMMNDSNCFAF